MTLRFCIFGLLLFGCGVKVCASEWSESNVDRAREAYVESQKLRPESDTEFDINPLLKRYDAATKYVAALESELVFPSDPETDVRVENRRYKGALRKLKPLKQGSAPVQVIMIITNICEFMDVARKYIKVLEDYMWDQSQRSFESR